MLLLLLESFGFGIVASIVAQLFKKCAYKDI